MKSRKAFFLSSCYQLLTQPCPPPPVRLAAPKQNQLTQKRMESFWKAQQTPPLAAGHPGPDVYTALSKPAFGTSTYYSGSRSALPPIHLRTPLFHTPLQRGRDGDQGCSRPPRAACRGATASAELKDTVVL